MPIKRGPHYKPNDTDREIVEAMAVVGMTQERIARRLMISVEVLVKYYRNELDVSADRATTAVGGALFNKAIKGDTAAQIFWMKTRGGWREKDQLEITGANGGAIETKRVLPEEDRRLMEQFIAQYVTIGSSEHVRIINQEDGRIEDHSQGYGVEGS